MTRCLFWNVEHFGEKRFYSASGDPDSAAGMTMAQSATDRQNLLYRMIEATTPDVIVIVEVLAQLIKGTVIAQQISAPIQLLNWLRTTAPAAVLSNEWRLVPPLWLAGQPGNSGLEAIAVFYRGVTGTTRRFFTGPNIWPGGSNGPSIIPDVATPDPQPYGLNTRNKQNVDLNAFLVPPGTVARAIPGGAQHNGGTDENAVAARTKLRLNNGGAAGAALSFGLARPPFMVTFTEEDNGVLRDLAIFGVHAPAKTAEAAAFIADLASAFEVAGPLGAHETRLVGGDFNANLLQPNGTPSTVFAPLTVANNYRQLLRPTAAAPGTPGELEAWKGYFGTHITPTDDETLVKTPQASRFLWSDGAAASRYPPYNYQSALFHSIDNVLVWPLDNQRNYQTTIMNTVLSSPLSAVAPLPAGVSAGSVPIAAEIAPIVPLLWPQAPDALDYDAGNAALLIAWQRYGHIAGTSDHFALFTDV